MKELKAGLFLQNFMASFGPKSVIAVISFFMTRTINLYFMDQLGG